MKQYWRRTGMSAWSAHCRWCGWIAPQASRSNRICAPSRSIKRFHAYALLAHSLTHHSPSIVPFPLTVRDRWDDGNEGFFGCSSDTNEDLTPRRHTIAFTVVIHMATPGDVKVELRLRDSSQSRCAQLLPTLCSSFCSSSCCVV